MSDDISRRAILRAMAVGSLAIGGRGFGRESLPAVTRIVNGFPAGGSVDAVCRRVADGLRGAVADTVIVENRPGAGGRIAIDVLKAGPADGSQWLVTPGSMLVIYPHVYKKLAYEPQRDLIPVAHLAQVPLALAVGPATPPGIQDVQGFVEWIRRNPAAANIGTPAAGNITHFLAFLFARSTGLNFQYVPFRGAAPAVQDLVGGQIAAVINPLTEMLPHVPGGKLRILAVTGRRRSNFVPQVPTFIEQGHPTVVGGEWIGLFAKAGTPGALVERMSAGVRAALATPIVGDAFAKLALNAVYESGSQLRGRVADELAGWRNVSQVFGFQLDE